MPARFWRLVGVRPYAGGDLELGALHWYGVGGRIDGSANLSCSHAPVAGALSALQDADAGTAVRFAAQHVRTAGFFLQWDFGSPVDLRYPRIGATERDAFLGWATLQFSSNGVAWETDLSFGRVIYPGPGQLTAVDPKFRVETPSAWDTASQGSGSLITGREARVWSNFAGIVRTNSPRSSGRRVFGLQLSVVNPPQTFFGGLAALNGWGTYTVGKHWTLYGHDGLLYYYPSGTLIAMSPNPGAPTVVGDICYFDVDLDTGRMAIRKNGGSWSAPVALPNFVVGAEYIIDLMAPSSSGAPVGAVLLTTAAELGAAIPSGATAWDSESGVNPFSDTSVMGCAPPSLLTAASVLVPAWATTRSAAQLARDVEFGGPGRIWGTTETELTPTTKVPTKSRVTLLRQRDKLVARETWSDPVTGEFVFEGLDTTQSFVALSEDADGNQQPVAANRLAPEVVA